MDQQGLVWITRRGKTQLPGEGEPYYHVADAVELRPVKRFRNLRELLAHLRGVDPDAH